MHPADIKAALQKKKSSLAQVARALEVSPTTVTQVVYGRATSRRIADEISKQSRMPLTRLFPGRYENRRAA